MSINIETQDYINQKNKTNQSNNNKNNGDEIGTFILATIVVFILYLIFFK